MDGLVVAKLTTSQEELRRAVRIINFVNLKPHSEAIVPVRLPNALGPSGTVLLEPLHFNMREGYWTARTVVKPEGNRSFCRVCNGTGDTILLKPGMPLATIEHIEPKAITQVSSQCNLRHEHQKIEKKNGQIFKNRCKIEKQEYLH